MAFAQDKEHRHVVVKIVKDDSDELRVMQHISAVSDITRFNGVLPILDYLQFDRHWFVVMPRSDQVVFVLYDH